MYKKIVWAKEYANFAERQSVNIKGQLILKQNQDTFWEKLQLNNFVSRSTDL